MTLWESADSINKDVLGLTMLVSGLFICFFGAKFFKHIIFFVGFILGGAASYFLIPDFMELLGFSISEEMLLYVSLAIGAAVGILFVIIYKAAVFSCGAIAGVIVCQAIWQSIIMPLGLDEEMPYPDVIQVCAWIVFALAGGWAAFKLAEFILKGVTAFLGAFLFASSVAYFISRLDNNDDSHDVMSWIQFFTTSTSYRKIGQTCNAYCYVCLSLWVIFFFAGCYVQYKFHKRHKRKDYDDDMSESGEEGSETEDEGDSRKAKRRQMKEQRKGGTVQPVRDQSSDHGYKRSFDGTASASPQYGGRASYYGQNSGYNGYSPNYNYGGGTASGANTGYNYSTGRSGHYSNPSGGSGVNYV